MENPDASTNTEPSTNTTTELSASSDFQPASFGEAIKADSIPEISREPEVVVPNTTAPATEPPEVKAPGVLGTEESRKEAEGLKNAMMAERRRRQEAEAELTRLRQPAPQPTVQNFYEDPEKFTKQVVEQTQKEMENKVLTMSEIMARSAHPDYDEKYQAFEQYARENPAILDQVLKSPLPAEAAYNYGREIVFRQKYGNDEQSIRTNMRKELEVEVRRDLQAEVYGTVKQKQNLPTSLSTARAASGSYTPEWRPSSFGDVLRGR